MEKIEFLEFRRRELVSVANAMLAGNINLIAGVRQLCSLRHQIDEPENEVFIALRGIDSETDHFPLGDVRKNWAAGPLRQMDAEMQNYFLDAKDDTLRSCQEIVRAFSKDI